MPSSRETTTRGKATSLADVYRRWFEVVSATTDDLREKAYRLRYQVYCVENAFEDPADNPDERETDEFDAHSAHSLLIHRPSGATAGTVRLVLPVQSMGAVRLVLPCPERPDHGLPIYQVCRHPLLRDPVKCPPATTAEISRFAISKQFRRRREDGQDADARSRKAPLSVGEDRRLIPHMAVGLLKGVMQMSFEHGVTHWCAVLEPSLLRLLARLGLHLTPLGPAVNYHGIRQPAYAEIASLAERTKRERPEVWEFCSDNGRFLTSRDLVTPRGSDA